MANYLKNGAAFNGVFDSTIRQAFREHRLELGLSLQDLARVLKIHWTTIRNWESNHHTTKCHPRHVGRVRSFLAGHFDAQLRRISGNDFQISSRECPNNLDEILNSLSPKEKWNLLERLIHEFFRNGEACPPFPEPPNWKK